MRLTPILGYEIAQSTKLFACKRNTHLKRCLGLQSAALPSNATAQIFCAILSLARQKLGHQSCSLYLESRFVCEVVVRIRQLLHCLSEEGAKVGCGGVDKKIRTLFDSRNNWPTFEQDERGEQPLPPEGVDFGQQLVVLAESGLDGAVGPEVVPHVRPIDVVDEPVPG